MISHSDKLVWEILGDGSDVNGMRLLSDGTFILGDGVSRDQSSRLEQGLFRGSEVTKTPGVETPLIVERKGEIDAFLFQPYAQRWLHYGSEAFTEKVRRVELSLSDHALMLDLPNMEARAKALHKSAQQEKKGWIVVALSVAALMMFLYCLYADSSYISRLIVGPFESGIVESVPRRLPVPLKQPYDSKMSDTGLKFEQVRQDGAHRVLVARFNRLCKSEGNVLTGVYNGATRRFQITIGPPVLDSDVVSGLYEEFDAQGKRLNRVSIYGAMGSRAVRIRNNGSDAKYWPDFFVAPINAGQATDSSSVIESSTMAVRLQPSLHSSPSEFVQTEKSKKKYRHLGRPVGAPFFLDVVRREVQASARQWSDAALERAPDGWLVPPLGHLRANDFYLPIGVTSNGVVPPRGHRKRREIIADDELEKISIATRTSSSRVRVWRGGRVHGKEKYSGADWREGERATLELGQPTKEGHSCKGRLTIPLEVKRPDRGLVLIDELPHIADILGWTTETGMQFVVTSPLQSAVLQGRSRTTQTPKYKSPFPSFVFGAFAYEPQHRRFVGAVHMFSQHGMNSEYLVLFE